MTAPWPNLPEYSQQQKTAIILSCILGFALDFYDILIMPFVMPAVQKSMGISLGQAASLTSVTLIGSVLGGALFGWIGDRLGRKQALQLSLLVFAAGSVASALSWDYPSLTVLRLVTGVGLGGEWGAGMVMFNEAWNKNRRGLGSAFIQGSAVISSSAASIVGAWATTAFSVDWGWRVALLTGGAPILLIVFVRLYMPESEVWKEHRRMQSAYPDVQTATGGNTFARLFSRPLLALTVKATLWLTAYMVCYFSVAVFMPTYMQKSLQAPQDVVRNATLVTSAISGLCYLAIGFLSDGWGRRFGALLPCVSWLVMAAGFLTVGRGPYHGSLATFPAFWIYLAFMMGHSSLAVAGPWLSELFPTAVRATAVSTIYMVGRGTSSIALVVVPVAAAYASQDLALGICAVAIPSIAVFLAMTLMLPETRRPAPSHELATSAG